MKTIIPLMLLIVAVAACGRFQTGENAAPAARPATKVVDIPSLIGKSKDEVKKSVTKSVSAETPEELKFDFPDGKLTVSFNEGIGRPIYFAVPRGPDIETAGASIERLGEFTGIDMKGRTPTKTDPMGTYYENETLDGKKVRIVFSPTMPGKDKFYEIRVSPRRN